MRCLRPMAFLVLFMGILHGEAVAAEPPATASTANSDAVHKADALFREGRRFVAEQKWSQAEEKFLAAWALHRTFDIATNLGHTQVHLGKYRDAAENLAFALRNWPILPEMAKRRALAQKQLDEVRPFVAGLSVRVNMPDAAIFVDGRRVGTSPMKEEIFLNPGTHTVEATLVGHDKAAQKVDAAKGATLTASLTLKPSPATNAVAEPPKAEALKTTQEATKQPEGNSQAVNAQPIKPQPIKPEPTQQGSKPPVRTIVIGAGVATSAALIGTGIGFAVAASHKASEADSMLTSLEKVNGPAPCRVPGPSAASCQRLDATLQERSRNADVATWTFIAGAVAGGGTVLYALVRPKRSKTSALQVLPVAAARSVGVAVRGEW